MNFTQRHKQRFDRQHRRALIIFTSDPVKEAQRKRIGRTLAETRKIYRTFLKHLLNIALAARCELPIDLVFASDASDRENITRSVREFPDHPGIHFLEHRETTFAGKFPDALQRTFALGYQQVAIIGNDCLDLTAATLLQAFTGLESRGAVIGPAKDGGFYLLGLNSFDATLFEGIDWCSTDVLRQLRANLEDAGFASQNLPSLSDIDSHRDLYAWLCDTGSRHTWLTAWLKMLLFPAVQELVYHPPYLHRYNRCRRTWQMPPPVSVTLAA